MCTLSFHQDYFGVCSEPVIKDNVVVVYEVLEEMLDNGFPLATESNILKELIKPPTILRTVVNTITGMGKGKTPESCCHHGCGVVWSLHCLECLLWGSQVSGCFNFALYSLEVWPERDFNYVENTWFQRQNEVKQLKNIFFLISEEKYDYCRNVGNTEEHKQHKINS